MKVLIGGAGGAPSENVISSLRAGPDDYCIIGVGSEPADLALSAADVKYQIPYAGQPGHKPALLHIIEKEKPNLAHFQNDYEILAVSGFRDDLIAAGVKLYLPSPSTIENCVDKWRSSEIWRQAGLAVPRTMLVNDESDLKKAFEILSGNSGAIWLRAVTGGGGRGALPADNYEFAKLWIDRFSGWGQFTAAELLTPDSVTWSSIWHQGELVVAQTRKRRAWTFGNRTLSGVTGVTRVGETASCPAVDRTAQEAILAIDPRPHGIFSVDMTCDFQRRPNPTEINIARFFTTIHFFTAAGLNLPRIYVDIALKNEFPVLDKKINPLPDGLIWIRAMDRPPLLTTTEALEKNINTEAMTAAASFSTGTQARTHKEV